MPVAPPAEDRTRRGPDRRILAAGVLLAAAAGAWVGQRLQEPSRIQATESPPLIDWRTARDIAVTMSRDEALSMADRRKLDAEYRALVARCVPIVSEYTGDHLPDAPERTFAFDRVDWVNANIDAFERMFAPLEGLSLLGDAASRSIAGQMFGTLNQKVLSAEVGLLLGYLARKVLGQYDLTLLGREPLGPGRLYYVEPNITAAERTLGLPREEFRMWLALHETTHAFEFEAHPWLRDHFNTMLERYFGFLREDAVNLRSQGLSGLRLYVDRVRSGRRRIRQLAGIADERRAARALHPDAGDDVYRRGVFQPRHERRRPRAAAQLRDDLAALRAATAAALPGGPASGQADRSRRQDGAVPPG